MFVKEATVNATGQLDNITGQFCMTLLTECMYLLPISQKIPKRFILLLLKSPNATL